MIKTVFFLLLVHPYLFLSFFFDVFKAKGKNTPLRQVYSDSPMNTFSGLHAIKITPVWAMSTTNDKMMDRGCPENSRPE
ncbi:MAG: hypothetical protein IPJ54_18380 [Saprospiraceae bacterium]|nr:hypothetical protein [Saprospiraceae bacterium]